MNLINMKLAEHWPGWKSDLHKLALGGAWLFAVGTLIPLLWLAVQSDVGVSRVFGTSVNGQDHGVWGLTYSGISGGLLLWVEILAVMAANALSVLPNDRLRRIGHGFFIFWSGWWALGTMYLATIDPGFWTLN